MTPAARVQAAIELLDWIIAAAKEQGAAADTLIARYFQQRRYAGSKDRRAVREFVYAAIRRTAVPPESGRAGMLGLAEERPELLELFDGSTYGPEQIAEGEEAAPAAPLPDWLRGRFAPELDETDIASLAGRAPLDLRVNGMHDSREEVLARLGAGEPGRHSARAIRLSEGFRVEDHEVWREGLIDIQDEGSQIVADACEPLPSSTIVDLCAGAGGKTLAIYDAVGGNAQIIACDADRGRLSKLAPRAERCRMPGIETRLLDPGREREQLADLAEGADLVLVDAPCSGTGTWRRNPEARWRLSEERIGFYADQQRRLIDIAAGLVAPGGALVYAVCSLLAEEGSGKIAEFLDRYSAFRKNTPVIESGIAAGAGFLLTPARDGTDGFFCARLKRP